MPVGGIERRLVAVLPKLRDMGWKPRLVCIREEGPLVEELRDAGIPVSLIPFSSRLSPSGIRKLATSFKQNRASVVHSHMYRSNVPATIAGKLAGTSAIFGQIHNVGTWESSRQRVVDRFLAKRRTGTITVSRAVQRDVMENLGLSEAQTPLLYNGVDMSAFENDPGARRHVRNELGIADDQPLFLVPARIVAQKNPIGVLKAFCNAAKSASGPAPVLAFAGDGKLEEELRAAAADHADVQILGRRNDMNALYNAADAVILSSFKEGFSNAVVEALACGKPVIASDVGGNAEAISKPEFGWIHDSGDGGALTAQIGEAMLKGVEGLGKMATGCRARAELFSLDGLVEQTHELYCKALGIEP